MTQECRSIRYVCVPSSEKKMYIVLGSSLNSAVALCVSLKFICYDITTRLLLKWEGIVHQRYRDHLQEEPQPKMSWFSSLKSVSLELFPVPADFSRLAACQGNLSKGWTPEEQCLICRGLYCLQCTSSLIVSLALTFDGGYPWVRRKCLTLNELQFCIFFTVWPWENHLAALGLSLPICNMQTSTEVQVGIPRLLEVFEGWNWDSRAVSIFQITTYICPWSGHTS